MKLILSIASLVSTVFCIAFILDGELLIALLFLGFAILMNVQRIEYLK